MKLPKPKQIHLFRSLEPGRGRGYIKATNEQVITAYRETGSVWAAAKRLGMCGQSIWERLRVLGYQIPGRKWSPEEVAELTRLAGECTASEIARRLGRPLATVIYRISKAGLSATYERRWQRKKAQRIAGYPKARVRKLVEELEVYKGSIRQFAIQRELDLELFVKAIQRHDMAFWDNYTRRRSDLHSKVCPYCKETFYPLTKKQQACSRRCSELSRRDAQYFGGKRRSTIGLAEGICQLCLEPKSNLSSHHMVGKENDPDNDYLIALCAGCHHLVGMLAGRKFVDSSDGWENLINLTLSRRLADKNAREQTDFVGVHTCVDIDWLKVEDLETDGLIQKAV